ncbi:hypothetical protein ACFSO7_21120 [Bacillus sp. CGMCC 1.16607]|uniref:hypothetical protein n=1 Tax=Bacillus sp. CGMCC 1.16607 TaxID=3351842 RepID=UPI0036376AAF
MEFKGIKKVFSNYSLTDVIKIEAIESGNTSSVFKVTTEQGIFILRSLKNEMQGEMEYRISEHFSNRASAPIIPEIFPTKNGEPFVNEHGTLYNLQHYLDGMKMTRDMNLQMAIGESVGLLHVTLETFEIDLVPVDRFDLSIL